MTTFCCFIADITRAGLTWVGVGYNDGLNAKCDTNAGEVYRSQSPGKLSSLESCKKSCQDDTGCQSITYHKSGWCSHFSTPCTKIVWERSGAVSLRILLGISTPHLYHVCHAPSIPLLHLLCPILAILFLTKVPRLPRFPTRRFLSARLWPARIPRSQLPVSNTTKSHGNRVSVLDVHTSLLQPLDLSCSPPWTTNA